MDREIKRISLAETCNIDDYENIARPFLKDVLHINYDECFISDESRLSDFSSCGLPDDLDIKGTLEELYDFWDEFIIKRIESMYGIKVPTDIYLTDLFETIRQDQLRMRS